MVISTNQRLRRDGLPYAQQGAVEDPGVAVYFELDGDERCIPCDRWDRIGDNYRAIGLTIGALRGLDRWGAKQMVDAAFRGFKALPAAEGFSSVDGALVALAHLAYGNDERWETLRDPPSRKAAFQIAAKRFHPDMGGDALLFSQLTKLMRFLEAA